MAVVSEGDLSIALAYMGDEEGYPVAVFNLRKAENAVSRLHAELFLSSNQTTVDAKKASVEINPRYIAAKDYEAHCELELEQHRARLRKATALPDIWRTESANARNAEKVF
jgi:hypothetical protein